MGNLNEAQIIQVQTYLEDKGITFEPLKDELLDHFLLDIESGINKGLSFEQSFQQITQQLAKHQLLTIEQETMEAISKQSTITTRFTYFALALLMLTTAFKLLHLPGTTLLLFTSIGAFTSSLLLGALTGIKRYRDKLGAGMLLAVIGSVILHILAWAFLILQLPGETGLRIISIVALIGTFSVATYQFATNDRFQNSILSYLHDKYAPGIERVLLIVLMVATLLKITAIIVGYPPNVGMVLLVFVISGGVLHFFATQWQMKLNQNQALLLIGLFIIGMIPALGTLVSTMTRVIFAASFYLIAGWWIVYSLKSNGLQKVMIAFTSIFYLTWSLQELGLISIEYSLIFNLVVLGILITSLALSWNERLLKIYFIIVIAHYLLEFPVDVGLGF